jgi:hypothetical protein
MIVARRAVLAAIAPLPVAAALPSPAFAQEIRVRGQTIRLSKPDKVWIKRRCEKLGHTKGPPA